MLYNATLQDKHIILNKLYSYRMLLNILFGKMYNMWQKMRQEGGRDPFAYNCRDVFKALSSI